MGIDKAEIQAANTPQDDTAASPPVKSARKKRWAPMLLTFMISLATWLILSGQFDPFHISLGIVSSFIVAYISGDLLFQNPVQKGFLARTIRFVIYIPWLMIQIFIANLHILKIVFHPKPMEIIDPRIVKFNSKLSGQMPLYISLCKTAPCEKFGEWPHCLKQLFAVVKILFVSHPAFWPFWKIRTYVSQSVHK